MNYLEGAEMYCIFVNLIRSQSHAYLVKDKFFAFYLCHNTIIYTRYTAPKYGPGPSSLNTWDRISLLPAHLIEAWLLIQVCSEDIPSRSP